MFGASAFVRAVIRAVSVRDVMNGEEDAWRPFPRRCSSGLLSLSYSD
jgi:hypothetical protein